MTKALKLTLIAGVALLLVHAVLRLGFFFANRLYFESAPTPEILGAFFHGLRFDVAGLILLNAPVLVLLHLPLPAVKPSAYLRVVLVLFVALNILGCALCIADFGYYASVQRRLYFEPLQGPTAHLANLGTWAETYPALVYGGLAGLALLAVVLTRMALRVHRALPETGGRIRSHGCALLVLGLAILGVRGGLGDHVMRPANAFAHTTSTAVGNMTLNTVYTVILGAVIPRHEVIEKMPAEDAARISFAMVKQPGERLLDPRYPFLRETAPTGERQPRNVVILQMESWTFTAVGPDEHGVSRTPFFDSLKEKGAYFPNFIASGQRSCEAIPAILASAPSLFHKPIIWSQLELRRYRGLGDILAPLGYDVAFHYGCSRSLEGFDAFTRLVGIDSYFSCDDYRGTEPPANRDTKHGIFDELFFLDAARRLDEIEGPFAAMMFSLHPHDPWTLPANRAPLFAAYANETPYQQTMRYSDFALRAFFDYARTRPWFERTIFILCADHARFAPPESFYESFHVPLLIYAPGHVAPQVRPEIGSHVDILPTVLDLLDVRTRHASMGRSLFDNDRTRYAVVRRGDRFVLFTNAWAYMHDMQREWGLFAYRKDRFFRTNRAAANPEVTARLREALFAYVQSATTALVHDVVWPQEDALREIR